MRPSLDALYLPRAAAPTQRSQTARDSRGEGWSYENDVIFAILSSTPRAQDPMESRGSTGSKVRSETLQAPNCEGAGLRQQATPNATTHVTSGRFVYGPTIWGLPRTRVPINRERRMGDPDSIAAPGLG